MPFSKKVVMIAQTFFLGYDQILNHPEVHNYTVTRYLGMT